MRIWLHTSAKASSVGSSTAISLAAHVVLVSAAVYGTGVRARALEQAIAERSAILRYLPPPDRHPSSEARVEHLQYVDIGSLGPSIVEHPDGRITLPAGTVKARAAGPDLGNETKTQAPSAPEESQDSVYSMLEVEEMAARTAGSAAPIYPSDLMKNGKEGSVSIRFVVDSSGRADSNSIEVLRSTDPAFTRSVRQAIPLMMFSPASVAGRHVRQAVEQNFEFRIAALAEHTRTKPTP
ncbi:MAG: energy transducer TonB [bacterium]